MKSCENCRFRIDELNGVSNYCNWWLKPIGEPMDRKVCEEWEMQPVADCEYASTCINPDTLDKDYICGIDGHYCPLAFPDLYKCRKTSVR